MLCSECEKKLVDVGVLVESLFQAKQYRAQILFLFFQIKVSLRSFTVKFSRLSSHPHNIVARVPLLSSSLPVWKSLMLTIFPHTCNPLRED